MKIFTIVILLNMFFSLAIASEKKYSATVSTGVTESRLQFATKTNLNNAVNSINSGKIKLFNTKIDLTINEKKYFLKFKAGLGQQTTTVDGVGNASSFEVMYGKYKVKTANIRTSLALGYSYEVNDINFLNKSIYKTLWKGPKIRLAWDYRIQKQVVSLFYNYKYLTYDGELVSKIANINIKQDGMANGHTIGINYEIALSNQSSIKFKFANYEYAITNGESITNSGVKQSLETLKWFGSDIQIEYRFLF